MRLDKWLWQARFFKSRALASRHVEEKRCRIDGRVVDKPHAVVVPGNVLAFALGPKIGSLLQERERSHHARGSASGPHGPGD